MVTVFHYTPVNAKQFDGLNIDGLAGKHQKRQNSPVKILRYTVYDKAPLATITKCVDYASVLMIGCPDDWVSWLAGFVVVKSNK